MSRSKFIGLISHIQSVAQSIRANRLVAYLRNFPASHPNWWSIGKASVVFMLFFSMCYGRLDPDFGWHLQAGNYFRAHGIPSHDVFSYTAPNFPWVDHEWGSDVLISYLYQFGGYILLALVFAGLWTFGLMLNAWRARFLFLLIAVAAMSTIVDIRPIVWTIVGLAIVLRILLMKKPGKAVLWIPIVFLVWANLHGSFILGLAVLFYFAIIRKDKLLFLVFLLCIPITFINPYGPKLYVEIFRVLFDWQMHFQTKGMAIFSIPSSAWPLIILWGTGFWIHARKKFVNWIGVVPVLLVASLYAVRNLFIFAALAAPELDNYYTRTKLLFPKFLPRAAKNILRTITVALVGLVIVFLYQNALPSSDREATYPVAEVSYLKAHQCKGNLFNDFDWGGYLIWKLPGNKVFIDGRMQAWSNPAGVNYFDIYQRVFSDSSFRNMTFKQYNITCALVDSSSTLVKQLETLGWQAQVKTNYAILLTAPH